MCLDSGRGHGVGSSDLNYPDDIVITINNSAMIIIFNAL